MQIARMQKLTKDLIAIDSSTGNEKEIAEFLERELAQKGMRVQRFEVEPNRYNILANWTDTPAKVLFNTHLDTVPRQFGPFEDDQRIYGRGACDTHGVLAAQLEALEELHVQGVEGLGILLVVGEETNHCGALHAGQCPEIQEPDILIVGEPTENKLMKSQKGRLKADLIAYGTEGHSGYPEKFESAVEKLLQALTLLWQSSWLKRNSADGTTMNVSMLQGGETDNQIPALARAGLMFRCAEPCADVKSKVTDSLRQLEKDLTFRKKANRHFKLKWDSAMSDPISDLTTLPGFEVGQAAFNTDIAYFGWKKCRTFLVGPGSILQAHKDLKKRKWRDAEWIAKQSQIDGAILYLKLVHAALAP